MKPILVISFSSLASQFDAWLKGMVSNSLAILATEMVVTGVCLLVFLVLLCFFPVAEIAKRTQDVAAK